VQPFLVRQLGPIRVGIFGLGISFDRLVLPSLHEGVSYQDPIAVGREMVQELRQRGCNLVVCLSHLGHRYRTDRVADVNVAAAVPGIDLVLGGHTHTFLDEPDVIRHDHERPTLVNQVGFAGIWLGRIDVTFGRDGSVASASAAPMPVAPTGAA